NAHFGGSIASKGCARPARSVTRATSSAGSDNSCMASLQNAVGRLSIFSAGVQVGITKKGESPSLPGLTWLDPAIHRLRKKYLSQRDGPSELGFTRVRHFRCASRVKLDSRWSSPRVTGG